MYLDRGYRRKRMWPTSYYPSINMTPTKVYMEYMPFSLFFIANINLQA